MKRFFSILLLLGLILSLGACAETGDPSYVVGDYRTTMAFHENFRILQLTDLHLGG